MHSDFPNIALSRHQLLRLQEAVIDRIVERENEVTKLKYLNAHHRSGCLLLVCEDTATVTWLSESLAGVQAPDGIGLKSIREN
jgi:hypothetical protein